MLDYLGIIVIAITLAVLFNLVISSTPDRLSIRMTFAGLCGGWVGVAIAAAAAGKLGDVAILGALFSFPLIATVGLTLGFPALRSALLAIPVPLIIGLNVFRLDGAFFLSLASGGRLAGPFPQSAGWGDIAVGAFALPVAFLAMRKGAGDPSVLVWNALGVLDLISAVTLGITSANGSRLQIFHDGVGSIAIQTLPWSLIPTVLVPVFLIGHGIVFAQAFSSVSRRAVPTSRLKKAGHAG
jgi:hypothetical protein